MNVLEVNNLHKRLGKKDIIKGISFSVKEGEIFGFLGPNGAGKTTTIRMLVGLISPNKGSIKISGYDIEKNRSFALKDVGSVVETPELYTYMSGKQNLMQLSRMCGNISNEDIDEIIKLVGLKDKINDKVKTYSLGMKQRLGLAEALLTKPKLLILDEPTNGLDPTGIIDFRNIIKKTAKERNTAVFISSHILSEIQQLCDTVAFIDDGVIKSIENADSVISVTVEGENGSIELESIELITTEIEKCNAILKSISYIHDYSTSNDVILMNIEKGTTSKIIYELSKNNIPIEEIYKKHQNIENRYVELVEGGTKQCGN